MIYLASMTKLVAAVAIAALTSPLLLADENSSLQIATGQKHGGYHRIGMNLSDELAKRGIDARVRATAGSMENLATLADLESPVSIALAQSDALVYFAHLQAALASRITILDDWGMECAFIVVPVDSPIRTDKDMQNTDGLRLAIPDPESGAAITFTYMSVLEPAFLSIRTVFMPAEDAIEELQQPAGERSVDAMMFVQHPKARPIEMRTVLEHLDRFHFVLVRDRALDDKLPNGQRVYTREKFTPIPMQPIEVETICTRRLIVANGEKLTPSDLNLIRRTLDESRWDVYRLDETE